MFSKRFISLIAAGLFVALPASAQEAGMATIADQNGCKVYNPMPQKEESIRWNGKCQDGFADGKGNLEWYIGGRLEERYEGEMKMGWAEGKGTFISRQGVRYEGEWKKSLQEGKGTIQNADGSVYEGEWKAGKPNGWGVYRSPDGESVEGQWEDGELKSDSSSRRI